METKKIAIACFIGGVLCSATALLFAPAYWWLGLIAGFAGGYISYEFREVRRAVPVALREAGSELGTGFLQLFRGIATFFAKDHPYGYLAIALNLSVVIWGYGFTTSGRHALGWVFASVGNFFTLLVYGGMLFWVASTFLLAFFMAFAHEGAHDEKCVWTDDPAKVKPEDENHYRTVLLTYADGYRWLAKGVGDAIGDAIGFVFWGMWKYMAIGIYIALKFICRFAWFLFKLIHSEKRVLCGVDGMLGGFASYLWLAPSTQTFAAHVMLVLFGGLLGTVFGVVNWEIVSKRVLHVQDAPSV